MAWTCKISPMKVIRSGAERKRRWQTNVRARQASQARNLKLCDSHEQQRWEWGRAGQQQSERRGDAAERRGEPPPLRLEPVALVDRERVEEEGLGDPSR